MSKRRSFIDPSTLRVTIATSCLLVFAYVGCTSDPTANPTQVASATVTGAGGGFAAGCWRNLPDQICIGDGPAEETCACPDCAERAKCTDGCNDDDICQNNGGDGPEDCSCRDCFDKVPECSPEIGGCEGLDGDGDPTGCTAGEPCTCPDCAMDASCTDPANCVDNGICNSIFEGCQCADCAAQCQGSGPGPASSSSGMGGSVASSTGAGGAGGTGAAGGAGGAGGN